MSAPTACILPRLHVGDRLRFAASSFSHRAISSDSSTAAMPIEFIAAAASTPLVDHRLENFARSRAREFRPP